MVIENRMVTDLNIDYVIFDVNLLFVGLRLWKLPGNVRNVSIVLLLLENTIIWVERSTFVEIDVESLETKMATEHFFVKCTQSM